MDNNEHSTVQMPSIGSILADKLTAFAPHTTGIMINANKDMEIIKQLYDITTLLNMDFNIREVLDTYPQIVRTECTYRNLNLSTTDILIDTLKASLCICSQGKLFNDTNEYDHHYKKGINSLKTHIFQLKFNSNIIAEDSTKLIYFLICLLTNSQYTNDVDVIEVDKNFQFINPAFGKMRYIQKVNPKAFSYLVKADELISQDDNIMLLFNKN